MNLPPALVLRVRLYKQIAWGYAHDKKTFGGTPYTPAERKHNLANARAIRDYLAREIRAHRLGLRGRWAEDWADNRRPLVLRPLALRDAEKEVA